MNPKFKPENFIEHSGTKMAVTALNTLIKKPLLFNPLFIYGPTGTGKTHLLISITYKLKEKNIPFQYLLPKDFALKGERLKRFKKGWIILDEFENLENFDKEKIEEFNYLIEYLFSNEVQLIFSSQGPIDKLNTLPEDLVSRIKGGLMIEISPPKQEEIRDIILKKAEEKELFIEDRFLNILSKKKYNNIREIEGDINELIIREITKGKIEEKDIEEITGIPVAAIIFSDIIPELERELEKVEKEAKEIEALKSFFKEKLYIWEMKGFKVDRLKKLLDSKDIELVKEEYKKFLKDIEKLIKFQKRYGEIKVRDSKIEEALFDPERVQEIESWFRNLEEKEISLEEPELIPAEEQEVELEEVEVETEAEEIEAVEVKEGLIKSEYNKRLVELIDSQIEKGIPKVIVVFSKPGRGLTTHLIYAYEKFEGEKIFYNSEELTDKIFENPLRLKEEILEKDYIIVDDGEIFLDISDLSEVIFPYLKEAYEKNKLILMGIKREEKEIVEEECSKEFFDVAEKVYLSKPDKKFVKKFLELRLQKNGVEKIEDIINSILEKEFDNILQVEKEIEKLTSSELEVQKEIEQEPAEKKISHYREERDTSDFPDNSGKKEIEFDIDTTEERVFEDFP
jgi:chromosomal replication initiator protein